MSCGARFYDLNKKPIICPSCSTEFTGEIKVKARRGRLPAEAEEAPVLDDVEDIAPAVVEADAEAEESDGDEETVSLEEIEEDGDDEDADDALAIEEDLEDLDDEDLDDLDDDMDEDIAEEEEEEK